MKFFILGLVILLLFAHKSMGQTGIISTIAGNGYPHDTGDGRAATAAALAFPFFCEFDAIGNFYFSARANHTVRKITPLGVISTIAGIGIAGYSGDGGPASAAKLNNPYGIAIDSFNNVYIAEVDGSRIRKIDAISGIITTYAGNGSVLDTGDGGHSSTAALGYPALLCFDSNYNLYFTSAYYRIRKIDRATGIVTHFAGTGVSGYTGDGGAATSAQLNQPMGICYDNAGSICIADWGNARIRKVNLTSNIITTVAGNGSGTYNGEGLPASSAQIGPLDLKCDHFGNLIFSDKNNHRIRELTTSGIVNTVGGNGTSGYSGDGSSATSANISNPYGLAIDICNNIYFADGSNYRIRKITSSMPVNPSITISAQSGNVLCYGMPVTFSSNTSYTGSSPAFQWKVNGVNVGSSAPTYTYPPANGDTIQCQLTSSLACLTTSPVVISNSIHMRVDTFTVPVVTLAGDSVAGAGATVHLTASIMGTAGLYTIHWKNHGMEFTTTTVPSVTYTKAAGTDTVTASLVSMGRGCYDSVSSSSRLVNDHNVLVGSLHLAVGSPHVYPNPVDNVLHVEAVAEIDDLIITNVLGQTVVNSGQQNGALSMALDVSGLSSGVYFVKVNGVCTNRFVKR